MTSGLSLKATGADTFYYPPEWDPSKGSLDSFQRKRGYEHHLGKDRVKNLDKGILKIRFEVPFHVRCTKCHLRIGQGTRFDADKKKVGKYHSTPIWEFTTWCKHTSDSGPTAFCDNILVWRTDPKNAEYELAAGMTRCVIDFDARDAETIEFLDDDTRRKMQTDAMFRLENTEKNETRKLRVKERDEHLRDLVDLQDSRWDGDYDANRALRSTFRVRKKEEIAREKEEAKPRNFALPLAASSSEDLAIAKAQAFRTDHDRVNVAVKRARIVAAPIFPSQRAQSDSAPSRREELIAKRRKVLLAQKMERRR